MTETYSLKRIQREADIPLLQIITLVNKNCTSLHWKINISVTFIENIGLVVREKYDLYNKVVSSSSSKDLICWVVGFFPLPNCFYALYQLTHLDFSDRRITLAFQPHSYQVAADTHS